MAAAMLSGVLRRVLNKKCPGRGATFAARATLNGHGADGRPVSSFSNSRSNWEEDDASRTTQERRRAFYSGPGNQSDRTIRTATSGTRSQSDGTVRTAMSAAALGAMAAASLFNTSEEEEEEEEEDGRRTDAQKQEDDEVWLLLEQAVSSAQSGELQASWDLLRRAAALAQRTGDDQGAFYTYCAMANLAYEQGQLDDAEELYKAAMWVMLSGGGGGGTLSRDDEDVFILIFLRLATIRADRNDTEQADAGYSFCIERLEAKLSEDVKDLREEGRLTKEEEEAEEALRKETRLLLGTCLDRRAFCRATAGRLTDAVLDYRHALLVCDRELGPTHPQTLTLTSNLATVLFLVGHRGDALLLATKAVELGRTAGHPDLHLLLGNMAAMLSRQGRPDESAGLYEEALSLARAAGDEEVAKLELVRREPVLFFKWGKASLQ